MRKKQLVVLVGICASVLFSACSFKTGFQGNEVNDDCVEILIENLTLGQDMPDLQAVEDAVNEITVPAIQCKIKIQNNHIADHESWLHLKFQQGESIDLINTGRTVPLTQMVNEGYLLPLEDLLEQYGNNLLEKNEKLWNGCKVNQHIYMVPENMYCSSESGFLYNAEIAEEMGFDIREQMTIEEVEDMAKQLKERGIYLISQGEANSGSILSSVLYPEIKYAGTSSSSYGIFDGSKKKSEIVNLFEQDIYLDYCKRIRRWNEEGYIPSDSLYSGKNVVDLFRNQTIFMMWTRKSPLELGFQAKNYDFKVGMFSMGKQELSTSSVQESGWGIASSSKNPEKVMEFLDFLYENADVANLLMNGLEGREYQKVSEHIIAPIKDTEHQQLGYTRYFSIFGDQMKVYLWEPMQEEDFFTMQEYYEEMPISPFLGYTFDSSDVDMETMAVDLIISEELPGLECGMIKDVEGAIDNLNKRLKEAGMDKIIESNQRQLNEWLRKEQEDN